MVRFAQLPASNHFDTLVMALSSAEIIWAWLFRRNTVEPSYLRFLDYQGGRARCVQFGYVDLHYPGHTIAQRNLDQINAMRSAEGRGLVDLTQPTTQLMCNVLHRDTPFCSIAAWRFWKAAFLRALPVYLPVYGIPMLLFKHKQLLRQPLQILVPTISNLLRSSMFLSSYCSVCWAVACATTQLGLMSQVKGAISGFCGGCCVAIEKKGRRTELALYVLSQSIPSSWRTLNQLGLVPIIKHGESLVFVFSMAVLMWSYVTRPHLMRSSYLSLFLWFFGSGGRSAGFSSRAVEHSQPNTVSDEMTSASGKRNNNPQVNHLTPTPLPSPSAAASSKDVNVNSLINGSNGIGRPRRQVRLSTVEDSPEQEDAADTTVAAAPIPSATTNIPAHAQDDEKQDA